MTTDLVEAADARLAGVGAGRLRLVGRRVQTVHRRVVQRKPVPVQRDAHGHLLLRHAALQVVVDGEVLRRTERQRGGEGGSLCDM